mgnify:FL=1
MVSSLQDRIIWLRERTAFAGLDGAVVEDIAAALECRTLTAQQTLLAVGAEPDGLYLLESGRLENPIETPAACSFLPGAIVNGRSLLLQQPIEKTLVDRKSVV